MSSSKYEFQIKIIKELSSLVSALDNPAEALKIIVLLTSDLMNVEVCSLMLPDGEELYIKYAVGLDKKIIESSRVKTKQSISGWVWKHKKPLLIKNIEQDKRFKRRNKEKYYTCSLLSVPVLRGREILAVLNVNNKKDKSTFDKYDLEAIYVVANLITISLTNFKNIETLKKNFSQLRIMYETQNVLSSTLEFNKRMEIILNTLKTIIKFKTASVFLIDDTDTFFEKKFSYPSPDLVQNKIFLSKIPEKIKKTIFEEKEIFYSPANKYKTFALKKFKDLFALPLIFENKVIGFVLAYDILLSLKDKELLKFLAGGMASSITNSLLYENLHKKYIELYYMQARIKEANCELEFLNNYNKLIIESLGSGFLVIDKEFKIKTINTAACGTFGISKEKTVNKKFTKKIFPEPFVKEILKSVLLEEKVIGKEITVFDKIIGISISYSRDGMFSGSVIRFRDMTEIVNLRKQLFNSEKMASIGRLATGIAHELNNPLSSVSGFIQLISKGLIEDEQKKEQYFKEIIYECRRMSEIINSLLNFAKIKPKDFQTFNLTTVVKRVKLLLASRLKAKNIKVIENIPKQVMFKGNINQIESLFMNLFVNSIDACAGGKIVINIKKEKNIIIEFKDTGEGIEKQRLENIFEPFYSTKDTGTGLGLAIVYNIIQSHNGKIQVESRKGEFTKFTVIL